MASPLRHINLPLFSGIFLAGLILLIALLGPYYALHNPLEETHVAQVDGKWINAPFPPFTVPGFPLGSDNFGRDVFSQMLWALRPTLLLVGYVALIRLLLGTLIGLIAGWDSKFLGSALNSIIGAALSIPTLLVALAIVSVAGSTWGPWGFVLGLSLTGWADSARIVRDQTRIARGQVFVEAARALGQTSFQTVTSHILRQVLPFVWMLLTFEISSTLLVVAGLGFLGYYVGGEVWIWISDTAATRLSGMPELGQMLSSVSGDIYTGPWKMFATGTLVFITVLGFNLLGEGLRRIASSGTQPSRWREALLRWRWRFEDETLPVVRRRVAERPVMYSIIAGVLVLGLVLTVRQVASALQPKPLIYPSPGGHLWGSQWHDPYATMLIDVESIQSPAIIWEFSDATGFSGGPVVAKDGTLYLATMGGTLYSLNPDGIVNWTANLPASSVGTPALDAEGNIYVTDKFGGLSSFTPTGELRWNFQLEESFEATSGPVVDLNGVAYYVIIGDVRAVSPSGELLWQTTAFGRRVSFTPVLSPDGRLVFLRNTPLDAQSGEVVRFDTLPTAEQFIVGLNGLLYSRFENRMTAFEVVNGNAQVLNQIQWSRTALFGFPTLTGVLADGTMWLHFNSDFEDSTLLWLDQNGELINRARFAYRPSMFMGMDRNLVYYVCGSRLQVECAAVRKGESKPIWTITLENGRIISGGALAPGRFYVATEEGYFYALGDQ
ncbi:MAG: PQQ-binding-like beta-propeller repeat protein [Anaerolineales bacterium]|nr:PQQ-binding-like beta-propeller repeat protein [Anaerolineales bacterium]